MNQNLLPAAWVDALFRRFTTTWGVQRVSSHFAPPGGHEPDWMEDVTNAWRAQLANFSGETLKRALQAAIDSGREWPPSLPEFRALCRQFNRPEQRMAALPAPGQARTDLETARANMARIKAMLGGAIKVMR